MSQRQQVLKLVSVNSKPSLLSERIASVRPKMLRVTSLNSLRGMARNEGLLMKIINLQARRPAAARVVEKLVDRLLEQSTTEITNLSGRCADVEHPPAGRTL